MHQALLFVVCNLSHLSISVCCEVMHYTETKCLIYWPDIISFIILSLSVSKKSEAIVIARSLSLLSLLLSCKNFNVAHFSKIINIILGKLLAISSCSGRTWGITLKAIIFTGCIGQVVVCLTADRKVCGSNPTLA